MHTSKLWNIELIAKLRQPYFLYLLGVTIVGYALVLVGLLNVRRYEEPLIFLLILFLAAASQLATTTAHVSSKTGITFEVSTAVSLVVIPIYGPLSATIIVAFSNFVVWLLKPNDSLTWKQSWEQLAFNGGMSSIAIFLAGVVFAWVRQAVGTETIWGQTVPWLAAAVVNDQANIWLLIGILRLQHGSKVEPFAIWRENRWAMPINILIMSVGGGLLAFAVQRFDVLGIVIFYLPIFLSAYAFRLYVSQMESHLNNLEQMVTDRTRELANLLKEKDSFLAILTHDMKSPLSTISLFVDLVKQNPTILQEKPHMLEIIGRSQKSLLNIVNNILDLENLESDGSLSLEKKRFALDELTEYLVGSMQIQASEKRIQIKYQPETRPLLLYADHYQIERVLQNLLSNAIKYSPDEGHITVSLYKKDHSAVVAIADTGYGIPSEELPFVFNRYHRVAKHSQLAMGTGLGLAITKAIVEAHGGTVSLTSQEGVGSTFTVWLPLTLPSPSH